MNSVLGNKYIFFSAPFASADNELGNFVVEQLRLGFLFHFSYVVLVLIHSFSEFGCA